MSEEIRNAVMDPFINKILIDVKILVMDHYEDIFSKGRLCEISTFLDGRDDEHARATFTSKDFFTDVKRVEDLKLNDEILFMITIDEFKVEIAGILKEKSWNHENKIILDIIKIK